MGRLVRILIYALVIFILYFWISALVKSYRNTSHTLQDQNIVSDSIFSDSLNSDMGLADTLNQHYSDENEVITNMDIVDGGIDYNAVDAKVKELEDKKRNKPDIASSIKNNNKGSSNEPTPVVSSNAKPAKKPAEKRVESVRDINNKPSQKVTGDGGSYMVMAGSYLLRENADKMKKKLISLGYSQAEVVIFSASEYHSVIAVRFSSESRAQAAASELKRKGIDSFVKTNK